MEFRTKDEVRKFIWNNIQVRFPPPWGRIPNFFGAERACERIRELEEYRKSRIVFSAPDSPLRRAREIILEDGKTLLAVKPRMTGFLLLKGVRDATIRGMMRHGKEIAENELKKLKGVDIFLQGCVAIDRYGNRIGKGSGYGDREYDLLKKHGLLENCLYVVVASDSQVFDDLSHLMSEHDVKADLILTPNSVILCER